MTTENYEIVPPSWEAVTNMMIAVLESNPSSTDAKEQLRETGRMLDLMIGAQNSDYGRGKLVAHFIAKEFDRRGITATVWYEFDEESDPVKGYKQIFDELLACDCCDINGIRFIPENGWEAISDYIIGGEAEEIVKAVEKYIPS
jgi:hypothetical protein